VAKEFLPPHFIEGRRRMLQHMELVLWTTVAVGKTGLTAFR
jgi:hypothetical protein